jgi:drug/metabolite transporter (DMT)-like permease
MGMQQVNRVSSVALILLSMTALLTVLIGIALEPRPLPRDEGTGAHIFQLAIALLVPATFLFLATADWRQPWRSARPLAVTAIATVLAFAALYYLEHVR